MTMTTAKKKTKTRAEGNLLNRRRFRTDTSAILLPPPPVRVRLLSCPETSGLFAPCEQPPASQPATFEMFQKLTRPPNPSGPRLASQMGVLVLVRVRGLTLLLLLLTFLPCKSTSSSGSNIQQGRLFKPIDSLTGLRSLGRNGKCMQ